MSASGSTRERWSRQKRVPRLVSLHEHAYAVARDDSLRGRTDGRFRRLACQRSYWLCRRFRNFCPLRQSVFIRKNVHPQKSVAGVSADFPSLSTKKFGPPQFLHKQEPISCCGRGNPGAKYQQCKREMSAGTAGDRGRSGGSRRFSRVNCRGVPKTCSGAFWTPWALRPPQRVLLTQWD
jgi:hypothetical protein